MQDTVSLPIDDTSLEGLEEYLSPEKQPDVQVNETKSASEKTEESKPTSEISDEELYENCPECHVALAASRFADICAESPDEAGSCELIGRSLADENTEPTDWLKAMVQTAEKAQGKAKEEMVGAIAELTDYLERRNSPFLKALDKEEGDGKVP